MSLFLEKLIKDGYEVEEFAQKLFPNGIPLTGSKETLLSDTKKLIKEHKTIFQATFETEEGLFAKIDILVFNTETSLKNFLEKHNKLEFDKLF